MGVHEIHGPIADLRAELEQERRDRQRALHVLGEALTERLELEVAELHRRIDEVHERALRELTRLTERSTPR